MKYHTELLTPDQISEQWVEILPLVKMYTNTNVGESTPTSTLFDCLAGHNQMWAIRDENKDLIGIAVTTVDTWVEYKALHLVGLAGKGWKQWNHLHKHLEDFARIMKCSVISQKGRRGWTKTLKNFEGQHGEKYEEVYTTMHMKLKDIEE